MSSLEESFSATLLAAAGVRGIVQKKVFPDIAPEKSAAPLIVFQRSDSFPDEASYTLSGPGLMRAPIQVSCLGRTWLESRAVVDAVAAAVAPYLFGGVLEGGFVVDSIHLGNLNDAGFDDTTQTFRFDRTLEVIHR